MLASPETRLSLLASLENPDAEQAWAEFSDLYRPLVIRVAVAKGLQHADAEDLAQEVLAKVGRSVGAFEHRGAGSFRRWLFQMTRNLVINHLTRGSGPKGSGDSNIQRLLNRKPADEDQTASLFLLEYKRCRFQKAAAAVRSQVTPDTWDAFWLTAVEQQSIQTVARKLGKSLGAVRVARCRVIARLRDEALRHDDSGLLLGQ